MEHDARQVEEFVKFLKMIPERIRRDVCVGIIEKSDVRDELVQAAMKVLEVNGND